MRRSSEYSPGLASCRGLHPIAELLLETDPIQIGDAPLEVCLGVGDRPIIHRRSDLLEDIIKQDAGFEIADILVEVLGHVAFDRLEELLGDVWRGGACP